MLQDAHRRCDGEAGVSLLKSGVGAGGTVPPSQDAVLSGESQNIAQFATRFRGTSPLDYYYESPEEVAVRIRRAGLRKQANLTVDSTAEEVQFWLVAWDFSVFKEDLKGYDGRKLLLMSKAEEQELSSRLQGPMRWPL
jgi:hypothetical protein